MDEEVKGIAYLNQFASERRRQLFYVCCSSTRFAEILSTLGPFSSTEQLIQTAYDVWDTLLSDDHLEAFQAHPRIGQKHPSPPTTTTSKTANTTSSSSSSSASDNREPTFEKFSSQEQSTAQNTADPETSAELFRLNQEYDRKFGHVFLICASGKSTQEILASLKVRIHNSPEQEMKVAASEQAQITEIRLRKLVAQLATEQKEALPKGNL